MSVVRDPTFTDRTVTGRSTAYVRGRSQRVPGHTRACPRARPPRTGSSRSR